MKLCTPLGGDFERTWGLIPPSVIAAMVNGGPVVIDPSTCASVVAAFSRAGVELPTAYSDVGEDRLMPGRVGDAALGDHLIGGPDGSRVLDRLVPDPVSKADED